MMLSSKVSLPAGLSLLIALHHELGTAINLLYSVPPSMHSMWYHMVMCSVYQLAKMCIVPCSCVSMKFKRINKCAENYDLSFSLSDANQF